MISSRQVWHPVQPAFYKCTYIFVNSRAFNLFFIRRGKTILGGDSLKKQLFYHLAIPFFVFMYSCSHLPGGAPTNDRQAASTPTSAAEPASDQARNNNDHSGRSASRAAATDTPLNADQPDSSLVLGSGQAKAGIAPDDLSIGDCPNDDIDCDPLDKESAGDNETQAILEEAIVFCDLAQTLWQKGELDNALESLDKAYSLIFDVDPRHDPKLMQQKEDLRFMISKRILEIYASRNMAVSGQYDEIPMERNAHIDAELRLFTVGHEKDAFLRAYKRSGRYRPYILQALKEAGLPEELSWLPLIESGFMVRALSPARALGLWQFIPSTGYKFGLKRTDYVDERMDFIKSTHAAIAYLKELHNLFGDWSTVLASYNCGEGRVLRLIRTQNINYLDNFWDLYQRLPRETARYVPRFIATLHIVKNPELYGLDNVVFEPELTWDEIEINRQAHLRDIGQVLGMDLGQLELFNPELRYQILPPEPYKLRLPKGQADVLLAQLNKIPTAALPERARTTQITHTVRPGETLSTIARRYKVSTDNIKRANNMKSATIRTGAKLKIPVAGSVAASAAPSGGTPRTKTLTHTVGKGDTLFGIAARYQTTVTQISKLNNLTSTTLKVGQILKIPGTTTAARERFGTYSVQAGDTPAAIARKHNMPLERFLSINKLTPDSTIFPGQKLLIEDSDA
jgi:membrane-bound lytic murein transglycosylase D